MARNAFVFFTKRKYKSTRNYSDCSEPNACFTNFAQLYHRSRVNQLIFNNENANCTSTIFQLQLTKTKLVSNIVKLGELT